MPAQQVTPVTCPNCNVQFTAPIQNIIDGQDVAQQSALLQGQLNNVHCPQCGYVGAAGVPLLYYDLEKELAFVFVPGGLTLTGSAQEKIVGDLTNKLINNLPAEQRKFFLFNPKSFLSMESMVKAIFAAEGVTEEMLQAQEARIKLLEEFFQCPDEASLKKKVKAHDAELDREFFELLTATMQTAQYSGDQARAQTFLTLRNLISRWSSNGKKIVAEIDKKLGLVVMKSQEDLLERLQAAASEEEFGSLVAAGHAFLDYGFFQQLTGKIDQAAKNGERETAQALTSLRTRILDAQTKNEERSKAALETAAKLLQEILQSGQPDKALDKILDQIDDAFFFILQANIEEAQRQGHTEAAKALQMIASIAMAKLQERYSAPAKKETAPQDKPKIHVASR